MECALDAGSLGSHKVPVPPLPSGLRQVPPSPTLLRDCQREPHSTTNRKTDRDRDGVETERGEGKSFFSIILC